MAFVDRDAAGHHGPRPAVAGQSAAGTLDPQPLPLSRSAQPCPGGIVEGAPQGTGGGRSRRRAGAARDSVDHQRDIGGGTEKRGKEEKGEKTKRRSAMYF